MSLPEGYLPRKGDEVLIRARMITADDGEEHYLAIVGREHHKVFLSNSEIHSLHCRHWNEGDRVTSEEFAGPGIVLATSDEWVWVMCETGYEEGVRYTFAANELEPYVEPEAGSQSVVADDDEIKA